jgi:hypothetical protein
VENSGNSGKTHRIFLNFVENTVVDERNLLENWGHPHGMMESWNIGYQNEKGLLLPKEHSVRGTLR